MLSVLCHCHCANLAIWMTSGGILGRLAISTTNYTKQKETNYMQILVWLGDPLLIEQ